MSFHTIPFRVSPVQFSLIVILSDESIQRIRNYDPAEVVLTEVTDRLGEPWTRLALKDVIISFATAEELKTVIALLEEGKALEAMRLTTRNYQYRPDNGGRSIGQAKGAAE